VMVASRKITTKKANTEASSMGIPSAR
jgi:hypothetical protein